ncbi:hypothetical protein PVT01_000048000 [Plasmodium vivax]|uniref:VIR protein n=1 Tax=Plasmodium vivax TaxID=5855 RepID=A0A1G4E947_PLAVI|nr:hypothetical protein PVT01_000048000 [Plasmodium vivax]
MAKKPPNPWYFTYQEYDAVKKSLVYEPKETIDVSFANHLINSIHNTPKKEEKLRETFCELKKLVQRHHCFYEPGPETCCNYINYWLNKTVRDSEYNVNKQNFNIFDKFMQDDPKIKEGPTTCKSKLSYMDNETFEKMKKLYDRNSRETTTLLPVTVSSSPAQGLETQARVESERTSSVPSEQFPLPLPLLPLGQSGPLESPETEEAEEYGRPKGLQEPEQPQVQLQEEDQVHRLKDDVDTFREDGEGTFLQEVDPSADSMQSTFNTETIMETIKGAVSNVLEAVEPVPILGVSGGIGALYLLFKYTSIGSLFRGNRRNNQNIPNFFDPRYGEQFSGYYPQYYNEGFPNYRMNIAYHPSSDELD